MGIALAIVLVIIAVLAFAAYGATPHVATAQCSGIDFFSHSFTINTNCQYVSDGELVIAIGSLLLALLSLLAARPGR